MELEETTEQEWTLEMKDEEAEQYLAYLEASEELIWN